LLHELTFVFLQSNFDRLATTRTKLSLSVDMVSVRSPVIAAAATAAVLVSRVNSHGYMLIPETQFSGIFCN
jgi:hypothetical protein